MSALADLMRCTEDRLIADNLDWEETITPALLELVQYIPGPDDENLLIFARLLRTIAKGIYVVGYRRGIATSQVEWVCEE